MKIAQVGPPDFNELEGVAAKKFQGATIGTVINDLLPYVFILAGLTMFLYLIFSGYQWMISRGDPKGIASAQQNITYAVVGFLVIFSAYWITRLLGMALDLQPILDIF